MRMLSIIDALHRYHKNRGSDYEWIKAANWPSYKTSNTLFIFGSGPSINDITSAQWDVIRQHDSLGLNFAFLTYYPMTYYYLGYEIGLKNDIQGIPEHGILRAFDYNTRLMYRNTLWFMPTKVLTRLVHPRLIPEFFPPSPKLALFKYPPVIGLEKDRPFRVEDFSKSLTYRGAMGVGLHLADRLRYKNIVLLGVDLHTHKHFYDDYDSMDNVLRERTSNGDYVDELPGGVFESMVPKGEKFRRMDEYYYAVNELYFKEKGCKIYVGNRDNILSPKIPYYPKFELPR